jgi:hypothetical protein
MDDYFLHVVLADGTEVAVPTAWFPRLRDATKEQRNIWRQMGKVVRIHWSDVDEDISAESFKIALSKIAFLHEN